MGVALFSRQARARINEHYRWQQENHHLTPSQAGQYARMLQEDAERLATQAARADLRPSQSPALGVVEGRHSVPIDLRHGRSRGGHFHFYFLRTGEDTIRVVAAIPTRSDQLSRLLEDLVMEPSVARLRSVEAPERPEPLGTE